MSCRKTIYSKIEKIQHKTLKVIYDIDDSYKNLLLPSISQINPEFMWSLFKQKKLFCNLRKGDILNVQRTQSTYHGTNM